LFCEVPQHCSVNTPQENIYFSISHHFYVGAVLSKNIKIPGYSRQENSSQFYLQDQNEFKCQITSITQNQIA